MKEFKNHNRYEENKKEQMNSLLIYFLYYYFLFYFLFILFLFSTCFWVLPLTEPVKMNMYLELNLEHLSQGRFPCPNSF